MADKRKHLDNEDLALPSLDLDDLDDGFDIPEQPKGPVRQFTANFKRGFLEQAKTRTMLRNFLRGALPDGYSRAMAGAESAWNEGSEIVRDVASKTDDDLELIASATESALPRLKRYAPSKAYSRIEQRVTEARKGFAANRAQKASAARYSDDARASEESEAIRQALDGLSVVGHEDDRNSEENAQRRFEAERIERNIHEQAKRGQIDGINRQLGDIRGALEHQVSFQDQITYQFQRKSLEMQYRSYFVLRDMRKYAEVNKELHESAYSALVHNTGLPDHLKTTQAERVKFGMHDKATSAVTELASQTLAQYMANYVPQIKENIKNKAVSGIRTAGSALSMGGPSLNAETAGRIAGGEASSFLQSTLMPGLARAARPTMRKLSDKLGGYDHMANYAINNAASMAQDYTQDLNNTTGWKGMLKSALRSVTPSYFLDDQVQDGSYQTIDRQASFNQLTQRSIVDVIPGYLSRLLHETRMMRTGNDDLDREVYDITGGTFTGFKEAKANARKRVITEVQRQNIGNTLDSVVGNYDAEGKLSEEAREALRERLLRDASKGGRFDARQYAEGGYSPDTDEATVEELTKFFKNRFEFEENGRLKRSKDNFERLDAYSNAFLELRNVVPDPRAELRRLHGAGSQEMLRELGLINSQHGVDRINYDRIWEMYRSDRKPGDEGGDEVPPATAGPSGPQPKGFREELRSRMEDGVGSLGAKVKSGVDQVRTRKPTSMGFNPNVFSRFEPITKESAGNAWQGLVNSSFVGNARSMGEDAMASASGTFDRLEPINKDTVTNAWQGVAGNSFVDNAKTKARDAFTPVGDVHNSLREQPLLLARDLRAGNYIDVNSGKIVKSLNDVTGEIRNRSGWVVATAGDLTEQLHDSTGRSLKSKISDVQNAGGPIPGLSRGIHAQVQSWAAKANELKDLFLPGGDKPVLLARDIKAGKYIDVNSGERIEGIDDISGEVKDEDGNTIITNEEASEGLVDSEGTKVQSSGTRRFINRYLSITTAPSKLMGRTLGRVGNAALGMVDSMFKKKDRDAYLPGEEEPRITVQGLKRGQYFDAESGDAIESFDAIKGGVKDADGNLILSADDRKELVTRDGKKHRAAQGTLRRMLRAGTTGLAKKAAKGYWNWTKRYYKGLGKKAKTLFTPKPWQKKDATEDEEETDTRDNDWVGKPKEEVPDDAPKNPTEGFLNRIYRTLENRLPEQDNLRKGGWRSIFAKRKAAKEETENDKDREESQGGILKKLFGGIGGALGLGGGRWDDDEEEEEDDGDINAYGEYEGGDKEDKKKKKEAKKRRKRMNNRGKPKGKLGRLWHGAKNLAKGGWDKVKGLGKTKWGARALQAGRFAAGKGGMLLRGAAMAGSAIASVVSAPVVIGAAVIGGAAVGGYMYYKKRKRASGVLRELRITQYGFSPNGWSSPGKLLDIEDVLNPAVNVPSSGDPTLDKDKIDMEKLFEAASIDSDDQEELAAFAGWLQNRFKPVFLAYHNALGKLAPEVGLNELDKALPKELGMKFLDMVTFKDNENSPYLYVNDPFDPGDTVSIDQDDINERIQEVKDHYKEFADKAEEEKAAGVDGRSAATLAATGKDKELKDTPQIINARKRFEERRKRYRERHGLDPKEAEDRTNTAKKAAAAVVAGGATVTSIREGKDNKSRIGLQRIANQSPTANAPVTPLQAIRLRAYGFDYITTETAEAILGLEDHIFSQMKVTRGGGRIGVSMSFQSKELLTWWQEAYPDVPMVVEQNGFYRFGAWLTKKFAPVIKEFAYGVLRTGKTENFASAEGSLTAKEKYQIAYGISYLKVRQGSGIRQGDKEYIWQVLQYIQLEKPDFQLAADNAEKDLKFLKEVMEKEKTLPATKAEGATATPTSNDTSRADNQGGDSARSGGNRPGATGSYAPEWSGSVGTGRRFNGPNGRYRKPGGKVQAQGFDFAGFSKGNGGVWESIPMPRSNKSMEASLPTLQAVAQMTGVDMGILVTFASIESAFDYKVTAKTSSATGWFQFINATWDQMMAEHASKYEIPPEDGSRSLRTDPRVNALMGAEFLKGNYNTLLKEVGRQPTDTDLYLAHFMGAHGAVKFLKQDTNAIAAQVFPAPAKANKSIFYKPGGGARTIGEVYQVMDEKVSKHRYGFGSGRDTGKHTANDEQFSPEQQAQAANGPMIQVAPSDAPGAYQPASEVEHLPPRRPPGARPQPSMAQRTSATVNPLNQSGASPGMSVPQGRAPQARAGGEPVTSQDPVVQHQAEARRQAVAADRRQQVQNAQTVTYSREMGALAEKQLKVQESMRDYLMEIAGTVAGVRKDGVNVSTGAKGSGTEKSTNDTSRPTQPQQQRGARSTPLPVNLRE